VNRIIKTNPSLTGEREIELDGQKLYYRFRDREQAYNLGDLVKVDENKHAIYIFDVRQTAIIVPLRAFSSEQEKETFLGRVQTQYPAPRSLTGTAEPAQAVPDNVRNKA